MKKQSLKAIKDANYEIYKGLVMYLIGPKWNGTKYQINDICSKSRAFGIIKVDSGYIGCKCSIYFDKDIRIFINYRHHSGAEYEVKYHFYECGSDYTGLPEDMDAYTSRSKVFLRELLRHVCCVDGMSAGRIELDSYQECVDLQVPENFAVPFGIWGLLSYEYHWNETDLLDYMTSVMKSKKFKRYRGDN